MLEKKHFTYIHEAGGHLLIGVFCGLVLNLQFGHSHESKTERQHEMINVARFDTEFFFLLLLPPIIFEAGYNMQRRKFFSNIGAICMYAFLGTSISTILIAGVVYAVSQASGTGGVFAATSDGEPFNGLESLIFGALISATDPVTVLAVFGAMGADLNLFSLVFGESVMNDAVAIVLYKALDGFNPSRCGDSCEVTGASITAAFGNFIYIFVGSVVVGTAIGLISALLYKHAKMYEEDFEHIEMILLVLFPYMSWMMAEAMQLSGIVSILFCGILMAHYTTHNLSPETEDFSRRFFKTMAFGCESFVFIYMGLATFTYEQDWDHWPIIVVAIIAILISRLFNVYPNSFLINLYRSDKKKIPMSYQHVMWFSGLRGAIAFALGLEAAEGYAVRADTDTPGAGLCILTMTLSIVIFTVLAMGGAVYTVLNFFDSPECSVFEGPPAVEDDKEGGGKPADDSKALGFDRKWFKPLFTWRYQDETKTTASERSALLYLLLCCAIHACDNRPSAIALRPTTRPADQLTRRPHAACLAVCICTGIRAGLRRISPVKFPVATAMAVAHRRQQRDQLTVVQDPRGRRKVFLRLASS